MQKFEQNQESHSSYSEEASGQLMVEEFSKVLGSFMKISDVECLKQYQMKGLLKLARRDSDSRTSG